MVSSRFIDLQALTVVASCIDVALSDIRDKQ